MLSKRKRIAFVITFELILRLNRTSPRVKARKRFVLAIVAEK